MVCPRRLTFQRPNSGAGRRLHRSGGSRASPRLRIFRDFIIFRENHAQMRMTSNRPCASFDLARCYENVSPCPRSTPRPPYCCPSFCAPAHESMPSARNSAQLLSAPNMQPHASQQLPPSARSRIRPNICAFTRCEPRLPEARIICPATTSPPSLDHEPLTTDNGTQTTDNEPLTFLPNLAIFTRLKRIPLGRCRPTDVITIYPPTTSRLWTSPADPPPPKEALKNTLKKLKKHPSPPPPWLGPSARRSSRS